MIKVIHKYTNRRGRVTSREITVTMGNNPLNHYWMCGREIRLAAKIAGLLVNADIGAIIIVDSDELEIKVRFSRFGEFFHEFIIYLLHVGNMIWIQHRVNFQHGTSTIASNVSDAVKFISYYIGQLVD